MKIEPAFDRILVRRIESERKTAGGIIIPDTAREKPDEGIVVAVGVGARDSHGKCIPVLFKEGQRIIFTKWSGTEIKRGGETLIIMKESDVLATIE